MKALLKAVCSFSLLSGFVGRYGLPSAILPPSTLPCLAFCAMIYLYIYAICDTIREYGWGKRQRADLKAQRYAVVGVWATLLYALASGLFVVAALCFVMWGAMGVPGASALPDSTSATPTANTVLVVNGPSGNGKTSLCRLLTGDKERFKPQSGAKSATRGVVHARFPVQTPRGLWAIVADTAGFFDTSHDALFVSREHREGYRQLAERYGHGIDVIIVCSDCGRWGEIFERTMTIIKNQMGVSVLNRILIVITKKEGRKLEKILDDDARKKIEQTFETAPFPEVVAVEMGGEDGEENRYPEQYEPSRKAGMNAIDRIVKRNNGSKWSNHLFDQARKEVTEAAAGITHPQKMRDKNEIVKQFNNGQLDKVAALGLLVEVKAGDDELRAEEAEKARVEKENKEVGDKAAKLEEKATKLEEENKELKNRPPEVHHHYHYESDNSCSIM